MTIQFFVKIVHSEQSKIYMCGFILSLNYSTAQCMQYITEQSRIYFIIKGDKLTEHYLL